MNAAPLGIVHVVESLDVGGLEHMVVAMAAWQRRQGHQVRIVCLWHEGALAAQARAADVPVFNCDKTTRGHWPSICRMRHLLREARPDVLHTHNAMGHYYSVLAGLGLGVRSVISTRHGAGGAKGSRLETLYKLAMLGTDFSVGVSAAIRTRLIGIGVVTEAKARSIPNGIDLSRFHSRSDDSAARMRQTLGLDEGAVTVGTVGRLNEVKRQVNMLRALRQCLDQGHRVCLVLAGDGAMRAELERVRDELQLQDHVRLLGTRHDVPDILAALDIFVLSSRSEGYSLALVEAASAALPIVATDVGGNSEIVRDGVNGLLVPAEDVPALAAALGKLASDAALRTRMGQTGQDWALRAGTLEAMCTAYDELYRR